MLKESHLLQVAQTVKVISKLLLNRFMSACLHDLGVCVWGMYRRCTDRFLFLGGACDLSKVPRGRRLQTIQGDRNPTMLVQGNFQQNQHEPGQDTSTQDPVSEARGGWPTLRALTLFQILRLCKSRPPGMMVISNGWIWTLIRSLLPKYSG